MDAVEFLTAEHHDLERRFEEALSSSSAEEKRRRSEDIAAHIAAHIAVEERLFYPAVHARWTEYDLLLSLEEHLSLKRLASDLLELNGAEATFHPKLKVLGDQAAHHHRQEEEYLFPKVNELLTPAERQTLGTEMERMRRELLRADESRDRVLQDTQRAVPLP